VRHKRTNLAVTELVIEEARKVRKGSLPAEVREVAVNCILDWLAVSIAGAGEPLSKILVDEAREVGGVPAATIVVHGFKTSAGSAALVNAAQADVLDFSDTNLNMRGQPSAAVVAAALAQAEACGSSGAELLTAIVTGVDLQCRLGLLVSESLLQEGYHPTGTLTHFGTTAAAASLIGLPYDKWPYALGLAACQAAGLLASGGTMGKPFHSGKAAMSGILSASLAAKGFQSRPDAIEASGGFIDTHASSVEEDAFLASRGRYLILDTLVKAHAACFLTHSTIEAILALMRDNAISASMVETVALTVPTSHLSVCNIEQPTTALEAKFSLRASAAITLLDYDTSDLSVYDDSIVRDPRVVDLCARVSVTDDPQMPHSASRVVLHLVDGRELAHRADTGKPLPLPQQRTMLERKFNALVHPVIGHDRAEELRQTVLHIDESSAVNALLELTKAN
jgi:2-methylcitrate dehydratase PrpD